MVQPAGLVVLGVRLICVLLVSAGVQAKAAGPLQLAVIDVKGVHRYSPAEVVRLTGLETGKTVTTSDLDAATNRLAATGLFKQVNYRYLTAAGKTTVTFMIEEAEWTIPVVFDNFVWFKDDEIVAALRQRIPSFDGTATILGGFSDLLTKELQTLLESKQIAGKVEFLPQGNLDTQVIEAFMFRVREPGPRICALHFVGATAIKEAELTERLAAEPEYSRWYIVRSSRGTLTDLYRQRGYWRAAFDGPASVLEQGGACSGVSVTIPVNEGAVYATDRIAWSGNAVLAAKALDAEMPLKSGDVANVAKLDEGLRRVQHAYGKQGYIMAKATYTPRLNDDTHRAAFDIAIDEGTQFRFGTVTFPGLAPDGVTILSGRWHLKTGEVFDATYPGDFFAQELMTRLKPGTTPPSMQTQIDKENHVVNVRFVFGR